MNKSTDATSDVWCCDFLIKIADDAISDAYRSLRREKQSKQWSQADRTSARIHSLLDLKEAIARPTTNKEQQP